MVNNLNGSTWKTFWKVTDHSNSNSLGYISEDGSNYLGLFFSGIYIFPALTLLDSETFGDILFKYFHGKSITTLSIE